MPDSNLIVITGPRGSGKTTEMFNQIVNWLGENEGSVIVFVSHGKWRADDLKFRFRTAGLIDVEVYPFFQWDWELKGRRPGLICVDDTHVIEPELWIRFIKDPVVMIADQILTSDGPKNF